MPRVVPGCALCLLPPCPRPLTVSRDPLRDRTTLWELHACRTPEVKPESGICVHSPSGPFLLTDRRCGRLMRHALTRTPDHGALRRRRRGPLRARAASRHRGADPTRRRARTPTSRWSPTPPTTGGCTASRSAPTSTPSCTRSATASTSSAGWGRRDETWHAKEELAAYGVERTWFGLGDRDLATHLVRTQMMDAGYPLSQVTEALCRRWLPAGSGGRSGCCR